MPPTLESFITGAEPEIIALAGIRLFFLLLILLISRNIPHLFLRWDGISHRAAGALHLAWLIFGVFTVISPSPQSQSEDEELSASWMYRCIVYDTILGCLGVTATLTAARDFPHRYIQNAPGQSGTLSHVAVVTQREMVEHSFYQGLNLIQALYLNGMGWWFYDIQVEGELLNFSWEVTGRKMLALFLVTSPWLVRQWFPVNSFSDNWTMAREQTLKNQSSSSSSSRLQRWVSTASKNRDKRQQQLEIFLYQIKKWQYVFYKHVILHGLNISVAFPSSSSSTQIPLTLTKSWRIFWLALNTSYVMEFFMQTLVKRRVLAQTTMLMLQRLLMTASSIAAIAAILNVVRPGAAVLSLVLNFGHRHHDVVNTMVVGVLASCLPWL